MTVADKENGPARPFSRVCDSFNHLESLLSVGRTLFDHAELKHLLFAAFEHSRHDNAGHSELLDGQGALFLIGQHGRAQHRTGQTD